MRLPAFVLLAALLWGAAAGATGAPSPAATTTAVRHAVVSDDGHALVLWSKAPPSPRGAILLLQGVGDGYVPPDAVARLFNTLGTADRSWVVLPDSDHAAHVEDAMPAWVGAIVHFIERPRSASRS
jgi:pimeloyl-ACP methyl ester carboxylesterase